MSSRATDMDGFHGASAGITSNSHTLERPSLRVLERMRAQRTSTGSSKNISVIRVLLIVDEEAVYTVVASEKDASLAYWTLAPSMRPIKSGRG